MTARTIADLTAAGVLLRPGGPADAPTVHADQLAALGRRRDLPSLLDRHTHYGPDQIACASDCAVATSITSSASTCCGGPAR
ncbi:hypothetical protein [Streptomyces sp. Isolate_45]|uniref:hypothetical protein n=1 Tax=Streptomyces sp. Isolate_45 TaxID=2950111 RepID=UPI002481989A|nr:hypothetical protein [Streptomyces sp. Isolate_45]MDA5279557.1 hypothetical protein [Streptomyces sp. Isolate_45]